MAWCTCGPAPDSASSSMTHCCGNGASKWLLAYFTDMPYAPFASGSLYYESSGDGPPLLLVPGLGGVASFWGAQRATLEASFTVISYDYRGSGRSTLSPPPYSIGGMAQDTITLLDHLK